MAQTVDGVLETDVVGFLVEVVDTVVLVSFVEVGVRYTVDCLAVDVLATSFVEVCVINVVAGLAVEVAAAVLVAATVLVKGCDVEITEIGRAHV